MNRTNQTFIKPLNIIVHTKRKIYVERIGKGTVHKRIIIFIATKELSIGYEL